MILVLASLVFYFPVLSQVQVFGKVSSPATISKPADDSANLRKAPGSGSSPAGPVGAEMSSADATLTPPASVPGRLVPELKAPAAPAPAAPDPAPVTPNVAQTPSLVPVYAPIKVTSERWRRHEWLALSIAANGTATFDAWSTRRVISSLPGAQEMNPLLRPFAGSDAMYPAVQVSPAILDYVSRRMMNSGRGWERHLWWLPQAVSAGVSLGSGIHNLGVYNAR